MSHFTIGIARDVVENEVALKVDPNGRPAMNSLPLGFSWSFRLLDTVLA